MQSRVLPYLSSEQYVAHPFSVVCGTLVFVTVDLVVFSENKFTVKTRRGIVWSEGLLLGASVVVFYAEKCQPE